MRKTQKRKETILEFETLFESDTEDGGYVVTVPKLPGLVTQGDTLKEAREMAKDAILCYMEGLLKDMVPVSRAGTKVHREKLTLSF